MTAVEDRPATEIGNARKRREDHHLITGRTTWTDNMTLPGMVHLAILRSPMAHARITSIDTTEAKGRPGVLAVFTGRDFAEIQGNIPCAWPVTPDMVNPGHPSLAVDQVNHAGEAVAVVAARTKTEAQDALEAIEVDYDPLPPVLDMEAAVAEGADLVHPNTTSNRSYEWVFESGAAGTGEPIDSALNGASGSASVGTSGSTATSATGGDASASGSVTLTRAQLEEIRQHVEKLRAATNAAMAKQP